MLVCPRSLIGLPRSWQDVTDLSWCRVGRYFLLCVRIAWQSVVASHSTWVPL